MEADELAKWRHAGELARDALQYGRKLIVAEGAVLSAVTRIEDYVRRNDGGLAFPVNIATDEEAAHWTPSSRTDRRFAAGELVKLDVGVEIDGYIGDNALTVEIDGSRHDELCAAALKGLEQVIELAAPGVTTGVLGSAVQATIEACGLRPVANLTGHGIKRYDLHSGLSIPSVGGHRGTALRKDDVIAVEPFATNGAGRVGGKRNSNIYTMWAAPVACATGRRQDCSSGFAASFTGSPSPSAGCTRSATSRASRSRGCCAAVRWDSTRCSTNWATGWWRRRSTRCC